MSIFKLLNMMNEGFVCPKCKCRFYKKWYEIMFTLHNLNELSLICPNCKVRSMCARSEER